MEIVALGAAIIILIVAVVLFLKRPVATGSISPADFERLKTENTALSISLAKAEEKTRGAIAEKESITALLKEEIDRLHDELLFVRNNLDQANQSLESGRSYYKSQQEKLNEQKIEVQQVREHFQKEFENIAEKLLKEKSKELVDVNRSNLDIILNPLKENIKAFEDKVEKVYKAESDERNVLRGEITQLVALNKQIGEDANNLTKALKGDTKKQGNWGEVILDRILEASGLIEGESYTKQGKGLSLTDEDGNRFQPDIIIHLPDKKHIVIDSKVSLIAYERLVNADDDAERETHLKHHIASIKNHINGLGSKNYQDLYGINSPDFVLLFVPIESSFAIATQRDVELFEFAWNKKVVLVTPSTLLATLKTVASIWKQEQQTRNAIEIASKAGLLYDKFVGFIADLKKIGDNLDKTKENYNEAFSKLSGGSGNLIGRVEVLRKLGAKTSKQIDQKYLEETSGDSE
ncbi:MAG: DNA recombination protein RmuC [Mucilaginibacter sp.]